MNQENYKPSSSASPEQRAALGRVANAIRQLNESCIMLNCSSDQLHQLAETIEATAATVKAHEGTRLLEYYEPQFDANSRDGIQPYSPVGGPQNPISPPLTYRVEGNKVFATAEYKHAHEGPPLSVHGGIVAGVYDQVMALACALNTQPGPTAYVNVNYKRMTPLFKTLTFSAWVDRIEGRKIFVRGECHCNGELLSEGEALFISHDPKTN
jgi:acyl-coenzyme A thioesterase PaaI-like protein